jgi:hypothetical protein
VLLASDLIVRVVRQRCLFGDADTEGGISKTNGMLALFTCACVKGMCLLLPFSPLKSQVPFTAALDALKSINPHVKYLESWYKVRRTAHL